MKVYGRFSNVVNKNIQEEVEDGRLSKPQRLIKSMLKSILRRKSSRKKKVISILELGLKIINFLGYF